jgi:protease I
MRPLFVIGIAAIIILLGILIYQRFGKTLFSLPKTETLMIEQPLEGKLIAMVIAFRDFRDIEYFIPRDDLKAAGANITTVSFEKGLAIGADGGEAPVDLTISEVDLENFDALLFIGGPGMAKKLDDEAAQNLARETIKADKILGAICIAPALLAKAGVLKDKKATVWSSPLDKSAVKILQENGADYQDQAVVIDGKIVTANGPEAAKEFDQAILNQLK